MALRDSRPSFAIRQSGNAPAMPGGVLHGLPLRPPSLAWDGQRYTGSRLLAFDAPAAQALPGVVAVMRREHYIGVVAVTAVLARQAVDSLYPVWRQVSDPTDKSGVPDSAAHRSTASDPQAYVWHLPARASDAGLAATAWCLQDRATVWAPCSEPRQQAGTRFGQGDAARGAVEEPDTKLGFQAADGFAER